MGYNPALYCGPNGYHNWGNNCPLGDLVDDYEMKDGSKFSWDNPKHKANPYVKRDARLYSTILYEGVQWRKRPDDALKIDPFSKIQVGHIYDKSGNMIKAGLDTREGPIEDWNGGKTGYYVRKWVDPTIDPQYVKQDIPFKHIRSAEVLMNYAEACIELGGADLQKGIDAMNLVRNRAGLPDRVTTDQARAREYVRHEREIEFFSEGHRFWDMRRWMICEQVIENVYATRIEHYDNGYTVCKWNKADLEDAREFKDKKFYWFLLTRSEMNKAPQIQQNPGYN